MGTWASIKKFLFGPSVTGAEVPDYAPLSDERLVELWEERAQLTVVARAALAAELERRQISVEDSDEPESFFRRPAQPVSSSARRPPRGPDVIIPPPATDPGAPFLGVQVNRAGILVHTRPGRWALVHLPCWDPAPASLPGDVALDAIIACNHDLRGWLSTSDLARAAGLGEQRVFAMADGPIDRTVGAAGGRAPLVPEASIIGRLRLDRIPHTFALLAQWPNARAAMVVGHLLPVLHLADPTPVGITGSIDPASAAWREALMVAHASSLMSAAGVPGPSGGVLVAGDAVGAHPSQFGFRDLGIGVQVDGGPCPVGANAVGALGCVLAARWDLVAPALESAGVADDLIGWLLIEDRLDDAARVLELSRVRLDSRGLSLEATLRALRGDRDGAIELHRRALAGDVACGSGPELAMLLAANGDPGGAISVARAAVESDGWLGAVALCRVLWLAGRAAEASDRYDELARGIRASLAVPLEELLATEPPKTPPLVHLSLAERAQDLAWRGGPDAERYQQRVAALDPR